MTLFSKSEAARFVAVPEEQVQEWLDAELIPFAQLPDGEYLIPMGGLQCAMTNLPGIDLEADLRSLNEFAERYGITDDTPEGSQNRSRRPD
jgi:hypothetical protein